MIYEGTFAAGIDPRASQSHQLPCLPNDEGPLPQEIFDFELARLLVDKARQMRESGANDESIAAFRNAIYLLRGSDVVTAASLAIELAAMLVQCGLFIEAARELDCFENVASNAPGLTVDFLCLKGNIHLLQQKFPDAESYFRHALEIESRSDNSDHEFMTCLKINLSMCLAEQYKCDEAETVCLNVLSELKRGGCGENSLLALNSLAKVMLLTQNFELAEQLSLQALSQLPPNGLPAAWAFANMGDLYRLTKDFRKSEQAYLQSLKILGELVGASHHVFANVQFCLAVLYMDQKMFLKSECLFRDALRTFLAVGDGPNTDSCLKLLNLITAQKKD